MDGQNLCTSSTLSEQLRVFISSAQKDENGLAWKDVRQRIKRTLSRCAPLSPFILEDEASPTPSSQFYRRQVEHSDLVVLLVKGEVRPGTLAEYALATQLHKPLLAYFLEDKQTKHQVKELKNDIETSDYCTYKLVSDFESIEYIIWKDIMDSIVREFQDKYYTSQLENNRTVNPFINEYNPNYLSGIPSRIEMAKFNSCYNHLFEILGFNHFVKKTEDSELHVLGISLIQWLYTGQWMVKNKDIDMLISESAEIFKKTDWLKKRWKAIYFALNGDFKKALSVEKSALKMARETNESAWVISNILIDCRNFEMSIYHRQHQYAVKGKFQRELETQNMIVCLPPLDRYLNNIYKNVEDDENRVKTASPYTELYGSHFSYALADLANYMFTAAIYGSYTHLQKSRDIFAYILDHYSEIIDESYLAFEAFKQHLLTGNTREFKLYIEYSWDTQYAFITSRADELWKLTDFVIATSRESMKLLVFSYLGLYLSDSEFKKTTKYIYDYSKNVYSNNSELYFNAILKNLERLNPNRVVESIVPIIAERRYSVGDKFSRIILYISLDKISERNLRKLASVLREQFSYLMSVNGDPQMLAALVYYDKIIFSDLEQIADNELNGFQKELYRMNLGLNRGESVLKEEIESARIQFENNRKEGVLVEYANNPYSMIGMIVRKEPDNKEIDRMVVHDFIPLAIDILNSDAPVQVKEPCLTCLDEILGHMNKKGETLPSALRDALLKVDINKGTDFSGSGTRRLLDIRLMMAKILVESANISSLLQWCYDFGNLDIREKIGIIDCLEMYLFRKRNSSTHFDPLILSFILQCSSEKNYLIRKNAIRCLAYVLSSSQNETILVAFNRAVYDPSDSVRMTLLNLCKSDFLSSKIAKNAIKILRNDANYCIRRKARQRRT